MLIPGTSHDLGLICWSDNEGPSKNLLVELGMLRADSHSAAVPLEKFMLAALSMTMAAVRCEPFMFPLKPVLPINWLKLSKVWFVDAESELWWSAESELVRLQWPSGGGGLRYALFVKYGDWDRFWCVELENCKWLVFTLLYDALVGVAARFWLLCLCGDRLGIGLTFRRLDDSARTEPDLSRQPFFISSRLSRHRCRSIFTFLSSTATLCWPIWFTLGSEPARVALKEGVIWSWLLYAFGVGVCQIK